MPSPEPLMFYEFSNLLLLRLGDRDALAPNSSPGNGGNALAQLSADGEFISRLFADCAPERSSVLTRALCDADGGEPASCMSPREVALYVNGVIEYLPPAA